MIDNFLLDYAPVTGFHPAENTDAASHRDDHCRGDDSGMARGSAPLAWARSIYPTS
jgi:hypothetical protein